MFRKILQSWLESWGYQVTVAEDGAQAWQNLQQVMPPHLLILDWIMRNSAPRSGEYGPDRATGTNPRPAAATTRRAAANTMRLAYRP